MKIGLRSHDGAEERLRYAQQIGADGASIWGEALPGYKEKGFATIEALCEMRERFARYDLELTGVGLGGQVVKNQLLGQPGRERDVENVCRTIQAIGEAYRDTDASPVLIIDQRITQIVREGITGGARVPSGPGGAYLYTFDIARFGGQMDTPAGEVSSEEVWERMAYLYERIIPVAEEARVRLATHPDDPPLAYYRGVHQVLNSFAGFKEFIARFPSPYNGLLLCLGCMQEAGEDVPAVIRYFGEQNKIFYVHFRNVRGKVPQYAEVFPHKGDMDAAAALRALRDVGYDRYIVADHHVGLLGDTSWSHMSQAWHVGYFIGLMQGLGVL